MSAAQAASGAWRGSGVTAKTTTVDRFEQTRLFSCDVESRLEITRIRRMRTSTDRGERVHISRVSKSLHWPGLAWQCGYHGVAIRLTRSRNLFFQLGGDALEQLIPVAPLALPEQAHRGIPGAIFSPELPAPLWYVVEGHPYRDSQAAR